MKLAATKRVLLACALAVPAFPQTTARDLAALAGRPDVLSALQLARSTEDKTVAEQIRLAQIPAPTFHEQARGEAVSKAFQQLGLTNVRTDEAGNVIGERRGTGGGATVVLSAHLDSVFPADTKLEVRRDGSVLIGPGIGDDARGLAVMLAVARLMREAKISTRGTVLFVATVGEEGLGDLKGVRHLYSKSLKGRIDRFMSIDGAGLSITHIAVGSNRYKVMFSGPGGHSYGSFGSANPIHGLGRAMATISDLEVPTEPKTTFNVGRIGGGTSVNSIAFEAWMEVDLRSSDPQALKTLDVQFRKAVAGAVSAENRRWKHRGAIEAKIDVAGTRPAGRLDPESPIVRIAADVSQVLQFPVSLREGSTDANIPISLGMQGITIGGGGSGSGAHSLDERYDTAESWKGTQRALLLTVALAQ